MKVLVIAPHPDDEVLGVGGTMVKYVKKGDEVFVCIVTSIYCPRKGEDLPRYRKNEKKIRKSEAFAVHDIIGTKEVVSLDLPNNKLDMIPHSELNEKLQRVFTKINPQIVFIPHRGDVHKAHHIVFDSCMVVVRPNRKNNLCRVLSYETLSSTEWSAHFKDNLFVPNVFYDITDSLQTKKRAFLQYKSERRTYPHPRSEQGIEYLARVRGSVIGVQAAEAFMLIREVNR